MNKNIENLIKEICQKNKRIESCGVILKHKSGDRVIECENASTNPEKNFEIKLSDQVNLIKNGKILAVFHSHIDQDEKFLDTDIKHSEELIAPYIVYSLKTKKFNTYIPNFAKRDKDIKNFFKIV